MKQKRETLTVMEDGRKLVRVPMGRSQTKYAEIFFDDWEFLVVDLGLSTSWRTDRNDYVQAYGQLATNLNVARLLLDAGVGQSIKYRDGDRLNLRRDNLSLVQSQLGTRRDRDFLHRKKVQEAGLE